MAEIPPNYLMENPEKFYKDSKFDYPRKAKGMSFFAFVFSIAIYVSIFYIFNLSPYVLLTNTKFWFFISNNIIMIIAADYGAFSSSSKENKLDLYDEYVFRNQTRNLPQHPVIAIKNSIPQDQEKSDDIPERVLEIIQHEPESRATIVHVTNCVTSCNKNVNVETNMSENGLKDVVDEEEKSIDVINTFQRSKSERAKQVMFEEDEVNTLQRSESDTEKYHHELPKMEEEINEFSTMTDEELNRKVEEFIQRFNRQIRLQGARNRRLLNNNE